MGDNPHQVLVKGSAFDVREAEDAAGTGAGLGGSRVLQLILCMLSCPMCELGVECRCRTQ